MKKHNGSNWNKWDLHLHSCHTHLNNRFPHNDKGSIIEQEFIDAVLESDVKAIGLTNYFNFCEKDYILKQKLNDLGIKTFLNLELRLNNFNHNNQNFDYHIIFDDKLKDNTIKTFINNVVAEVGSTSKKLSQLTPQEIEASAQVNFGHLIEKLEEESSELQGRYLLAFLSRGHGSARTAGRDAANYETVTRKSDFVIHSSDNTKNIVNDREFWLNSSPYTKALLQGSDAHNLDMIGTKYSWIKADLTFNGLRQITYEPKDRICLETDHPDKKADYQVIESVSFNQHNETSNSIETTVSFNSNLNTVIGGRSNGKSTLTNSIAQALNNLIFNEQNEKNGIGMFTFKEESSTRVIWKDGQINKGNENQRDIEFLPQDYMIRIAESDELRNKLIEETVKADANSYQKIVDFDDATQSLQYKINNLFQELITFKEDLLKLSSPEGDQTGIKNQLTKLNEQFLEQEKKSNFSDKDSEDFESKKTALKNATNLKIKAESDTSALHSHLEETIEIKNDFPGVSEETSKKLNEFIKEQQEKLNSAWKSKLNDIIQEQRIVIKRQEEEINKITESDQYIKGQENISSNKTLMSLTEQIEGEEKKLEEFIKYEETLNYLETQILQKKDEIATNYLEFKNLRENLSQSFNVRANSVEIKLDFIPVSFEDNIDYLNGRSATNNSFIEDFDKDSDKKIKFVLENLDSLKLSYNRGKDQMDLIKDILSRQWFKRNYTLKFDGDNFLQMSQGKKAFVILTLILEFSKDEKPVIIDQPEDSLDNRAIYIELTKYLKEKKQDRQIILVTHNPNVVVGADAENVIVANQHSEVSPNIRKKQFDYVNGSLENSLSNNEAEEFLNKRGIREHVVEILEGGNEAFKKREEKYDLS